MPDTTTTDPVADRLAEIRERWAKIETVECRDGVVPEIRGTTRADPAEWRADIPALVAAVKAALADHGDRGVFLGADECDHPEPPRPQGPSGKSTPWDDWDADHPLGAGDVGRICLQTEIGRYCPACTQLVYEDDPIGDSYVNAADCIVLPAVSAALLGEGNGSG